MLAVKAVPVRAPARRVRGEHLVVSVEGSRMRVVVIGGGGAGREMLDVIEASNEAGSSSLEVIGVFDDGEPDLQKLAAYGVDHLGGTDRARGVGSAMSAT